MPPRVPIELRSALTNSTDRLQPIALLCSFAAFYEALCALLGLEDGAPEANASDVTESISGRVRCTENSECGNDAASIASSAASLPARIAASARATVTARVSFPFKQRLAARSVRRAQRAKWLADVPITRRGQDDFVRAAMGFTPEYLSHVRSTAHRAVFLYLLDDILLRDSSHGISTAVKQLVCYILARSAENSVLTAHAAFLANRFGADDHQLAACMDFPFLHSLHALYATRSHGVEEVTASSATSTSSSVSSPPQSPPPVHVPGGVRKRRRSPNLPYPRFDDRDDSYVAHFSRGAEPYAPRQARPFQSARQERRDAMLARCVADSAAIEDLHSGVDCALQEEGDLGFESAPRVKILPDDDGAASSRFALEPLHSLPDLSIDDTDSLDGSVSSASEPCAVLGAIEAHADDDNFTISTEHSMYDLRDNPEVPDVNGLNSMNTVDCDIFDDDIEDNYDYDFYGQFTPAVERPVFEEEEGFNDYDDMEAPMEVEHSIFSEKEVAVLLLAHDVAQASRRNSRRCAKYADAMPGPLVAPARAELIRELFEPEAIMEIIAVIASFQLLQRWTVCYPYRPGSLEAPVRRFVQTPIAHDLCVGAVGQRSSSKSSALLRTQEGRALRLPKHVLVSSV